MSIDLAARYTKLRDEITAEMVKAGRKPADVTLIAVSKGQPAASIEAALALGMQDFGENRVQEAQQKFFAAAATLHLLGPLQRNKVSAACALFDTIHSLDRTALAQELAKERDKRGRCPQLFIQVNTGAEPQKSGVSLANLPELVALTRALELPLIGLMAIPPQNQDARYHFDLLRTLAQEHGLSALSMGMSADYKEAIAAGATHLRIGTALFGARPA